ncbi:hypothetical protein NLY09_30345 (plasmid) [Burkholderia vietnamiensis]
MTIRTASRIKQEKSLAQLALGEIKQYSTRVELQHSKSAGGSAMEKSDIEDLYETRGIPAIVCCRESRDGVVVSVKTWRGGGEVDEREFNGETASSAIQTAHSTLHSEFLNAEFANNPATKPIVAKPNTTASGNTKV